MAALRKPASCSCGCITLIHKFNPERWVCDDCKTAVVQRPQRVSGICRDCGASETEKPFKKGKNQCLDCNNIYMVKWRLKNPEWDSSPEFKRKRSEAVKKCVEASPTSFIKTLYNRLTRPSRKNSTRNFAIGPKRLAILNDVRIVLDDLLALWVSQEGRCAITGVPMMHQFNHLRSISIDRIDSAKGYIPGNVQLAAKATNLAKGLSTNEAAKEFFAMVVQYASPNFVPSNVLDIDTSDPDLNVENFDIIDEDNDMEISIETPWGLSEDVDEVIDGIAFVSTPSHGGYKLSKGRQAQFKAKFPSFMPFTGSLEWFEEDCDAMAVIVAFPEAFTAELVVRAKESVRDEPDYFATIIPYIKD